MSGPGAVSGDASAPRLCASPSVSRQVYYKVLASDRETSAREVRAADLGIGLAKIWRM